MKHHSLHKTSLINKRHVKQLGKFSRWIHNSPCYNNYCITYFVLLLAHWKKKVIKLSQSKKIILNKIWREELCHALLFSKFEYIQTIQLWRGQFIIISQCDVGPTQLAIYRRKCIPLYFWEKYDRFYRSLFLFYLLVTYREIINYWTNERAQFSNQDSEFVCSFALCPNRNFIYLYF